MSGRAHRDHLQEGSGNAVIRIVRRPGILVSVVSKFRRSPDIKQKGRVQGYSHVGVNGTARMVSLLMLGPPVEAWPPSGTLNSRGSKVKGGSGLTSTMPGQVIVKDGSPGS